MKKRAVGDVGSDNRIRHSVYYVRHKIDISRGC